MGRLSTRMLINHLEDPESPLTRIELPRNCKCAAPLRPPNARRSVGETFLILMRKKKSNILLPDKISLLRNDKTSAAGTPTLLFTALTKI